MTITITEKEYFAISQVLDQVNTDYEAASDEQYLNTMAANINLVNKVLSKYREAKRRADDFCLARACVREKSNGRLSEKDIDKAARILVREFREYKANGGVFKKD